MLAVLAIAATIRIWSVGYPGGLVFDEAFYAQDACTLVESAAVCDRPAPITEEHPFMAKWLIAITISLFGYEGWAWRIMPVAFGIAGVGLTYLLARRVLATTWAATTAGMLIAFDFLHFEMSRVAMLDIFVATFALAAVLFAVVDRDRPHGEGRERLRDRPWLLACGAALGAAVASKWSGAFFFPVVALAVLAWDADRRGGSGRRQRWLGTLRSEWAIVLVAFLVIPSVIYVASFGNRFDGTLLAFPWDRDSWWWDLARRQVVMLRRHIDLTGLYPYTTPAWSWPLLKRPFIMVFEEHPGDVTRHVLGIGNPAIWWPALVALVVVTFRWLRGPRGSSRPEGVILLGYVAGYAVWLPLTMSRPFSFPFYMLPAVPFMVLALVRCLQLLPWSRLRQAFAGAYVAVVIALFAFFYPVLTAQPLEPEPWLARMWFRDCLPSQMAVYPPRPPSVPTDAPEGWCWI